VDLDHVTCLGFFRTLQTLLSNFKSIALTMIVPGLDKSRVSATLNSLGCRLVISANIISSLDVANFDTILLNV
jgi:hypothetical protein